MKNKLILLILVFSCVITYSKESGYILKVLASKGSVEFVQSGKGGKVFLKTGSEIRSKGEIILDDKEYLSLTHSSGRLLELTNKGKYKVDELDRAIDENSKSLTGKFIDFVGEKLSGSGKKTKEMRSTGAVVRVRDDYLFVDLPLRSILLNEPLDIEYEVADTTLSYLMFISNMEGQLVNVQELQKGYMKLDIHNSGLTPGRNYKLFIKGMGAVQLISDTIIVSIADKEILQRIADSESILKAQDEKTLSPINAICAAIFYEENGFLVNAYKMYKLAILGMEGVEEYENLYLDFLFKNGLDIKGEQFFLHKSRSKGRQM